MTSHGRAGVAADPYLQNTPRPGERRCRCFLATVPRVVLTGLAVLLGSLLPAADSRAQALPPDRVALLALYNTTGGPSWNNNQYWLSDRALEEWYGVTVENGRVTGLSLSRNQLAGPLPSALGKLANLQRLDLGYNRLTGSIPSELGKLVNLQRLDLGDNELTGSIPSELGKLANLQWLSLSGNELTGPIPSDIGKLANLERLFLGGNELTGAIPSDMGKLANLEWLFLYDNQLTGPIPPALWKLANLERLWLQRNRLTGPFPPELSHLADLEQLILSNNQLTGPVPVELVNLANLQRLDLGQNKLTGSIPVELVNLANLQRLGLGQNKLTGSIPVELGNLANLQSLSLGFNRLTGSIPPELGKLANLESLRLRVNQLTGSIPPELGNLANLRQLLLSDNRLTGAIPPELGNLVNLEVLWASDNRLTGPIPPELGNLAKLQSLIFNRNQLTGTIPLSFTNLVALDSFWFGQNNGLCAPADTSIRTWLIGIRSVAGGNCSSTWRASSIFVPVILSAAGQNESLFVSEMTLTNWSDEEATLHYTYTAHRGEGSGTATDRLAPRGQRIEPDALGYLRRLGVPIAATGNRIGTLRVEVSGSHGVSVMTRTTTGVPEGRVGLAYPGIAGQHGFQEAVFLCGLRQNDRDRSNVAIQNMGAAGEGAITLRTTVFSGEADDTGSRVVGEVTLEPGGFHQYSGLLRVLGGPAQGYVKVEKVEGSAPFYAYGVINDRFNSDGSFVFPVAEFSLVGASGQTLPVIVEAGSYDSELTVTNFSASAKTLDFSFVADAIHTAGNATTFGLRLKAGQQIILPDLVGWLRQEEVAGIGPANRDFLGALFATEVDGDMSGIVIGARTGAPDRRGGQYSVFYSAVPYGPYGGSFDSTAWIDALRQDEENRSNLALVNTGEVDDSDSVFTLEIYDGATGQLANTVTGIRIPALGWYQVNNILGNYTRGTTQGYVRIRKVSGANPFLVYGVINDGARRGERSGDGAYLPARK